MARLLTGTDKIATANYTAGNTGTISLWLRPNWNSGDSVQRYIFTSNDTDIDNPSFQRFSDNNIYCGFTQGGNSRLVIADTSLFVSGSPANWVFTWSAASGQTLYQNASSKGTGAYINHVNSMPFFIIGNRGTGANPVTGSIADFAVWDVVLTTGEIASLASGVRPSRIREASLQVWLPLDGIESPEPDLSGHLISGTLTGTALAAGPPMTLFTPKPPILPLLAAQVSPAQIYAFDQMAARFSRNITTIGY